MLRNIDGGGGGITFSGEKCYEGVRFNIISVARGWVGVQFPKKKRYVTLEWPHISEMLEIQSQIFELISPTTSLHVD